MDPLKAIRGTSDILPADMPYWHRIEKVVRDVMRRFGYREIRTPVFEETGLFARSIGEDTDIVVKEMYTFHDLGGRSLTLRPEGTASVVRAFIEHSLDQQGLPQKLWYMGPMFRQERPQKGRQRQFHQFGVEAVGSPDSLMDAEVMHLFDVIAGELGFDEREYLLNCLGGEESRSAYRAELVKFLNGVKGKLCSNCQRRVETNPLRVLDCKEPDCRTVLESPALPRTTDHLTEDDRAIFEEVRRHLEGLGIRYRIEPSLVRGLDYYTGTVFEMELAGLGAQSAVMGGGRYDRLIADLGGKDLPAVGFACGMERLILAMKKNEEKPVEAGAIDVYVVSPDESSRDMAVRYLSEIRNFGFAAEMDYLGRSMKAQMKAAARAHASTALIVEPGGMASVKDMRTSSQETMSFESFINTLKSRNKKSNQ
ncbi:histidine--tRNA ligase [Candidatus Latescibacterota bacterium]